MLVSNMLERGYNTEPIQGRLAYLLYNWLRSIRVGPDSLVTLSLIYYLLYDTWRTLNDSSSIIRCLAHP